MSTWNDNRLDELSTRTDAGFKEVKEEFKEVRAEMRDGFARVDKRFEKVDQEFKEVRAEMKEGFTQVDQRFDRIDERFHRLWRTLTVASFGIIGAIIGTGILG